MIRTFGAVLDEQKDAQSSREVLGIIADNLSKAGWSWGCVSAIDSKGRTIWIADAHRDDGKRFVVRADEKLTAFVELELAFRACGPLEVPRQEIRQPSLDRGHIIRFG